MESFLDKIAEKPDTEEIEEPENDYMQSLI